MALPEILKKLRTNTAKHGKQLDIALENNGNTELLSWLSASEETDSKYKVK